MQSFCPHCEMITPASNVISKLDYKIKGIDVSVEVPLVRCAECNNEFESPELGHDVADMALRAYRETVGLLSPDDIRTFRNSLNLTQQELGKLLGWGGASLSRYENGALQDEAHDRAFRMIMEPDAMLGILEQNPNIITNEKREALIQRLRSSESAESALRTFFRRYLTDYEPDIRSGFRRFNAQKFFAMVLHFCRDSGVPKTKLNKLLWYSDFLFFKRNTVSISGTRYAHLPYGPAPDKYDTYLAFLTDIDKGLAVTLDSYDSRTWEILVSTRAPDYSVFSNTELQTLTSVAESFANTTAKAISDISHEESGYKETTDGEIISYVFADDLNSIE